MTQRMDKSIDDAFAKLLLESAGRIRTTVVAFGSILMQIAGASSPGAVTEDAILDSALLASVTYNNGGVVTAFRRESIE